MYYNNPTHKLRTYKGRNLVQPVLIITMIVFLYAYPISQTYWGAIGAFFILIAGQAVDALVMYKLNKDDERRVRAWKTQTAKDFKGVLIMVLVIAVTVAVMKLL